MAFDNVVLPFDVARFSATIEYNTTIVVTDNGSESRNANWDDARLSFNAASGVKTTADLATLVKFFRDRKGAARGFLVKDWSDFQASNEALGTRTGSSAQAFQLVKTYSDYTTSDPVYGTTGNAEVREIYKPKNGTVQVYAGVTLLVAGTDYTLNYATGLLTILAGRVSAGSLLTWNGEFYVPVRFLEDKLRTDLILWKINSGLGSAEVPLIETRDIS